MTGFSSPVISLAWSTTGEQLAVADEAALIRVWDIATGEVVAELSGQWNSVPDEPLVHLVEHTGTVWRVAWSPTGDQLASIGDDGGFGCGM